MNKRRALLMGSVFVAAIAGTVTVAGRQGPFARVDAGAVHTSVTARGVVIPQEGVADVRAHTSGHVLRVLVREGDTVGKGDLLAELQGETGTVRVEAPVAGQVLARRVDPGDSINAFVDAQGLFEIADVSKLELRVEIEDHDTPRVAVGTPVRLVPIDGGDAVARGVIARMAPRVERRGVTAEDVRVRADGRVRVAWVSLNAGDAAKLTVGEQFEVVVELPDRTAAARVPRDAVAVRDGRTVLDVGWGPLTREVRVTLGAVDDTFAEVYGVNVGQRVRRYP